MKLVNRIAASAALLGALSLVQAESITFGVDIAPVASLSVRDGMLKDVSSMYSTLPITVLTGVTVGGFTVVTNMPKWNIYFAFANGGALKNQSGTQIKDDVGNPAFLGNVPIAVANAADQAVVFLKTSDPIKAKDVTAVPLAVGTLNIATSAPKVNNVTNNTLTKALDGSAGKNVLMVTACGAAVCDFSTTSWLAATDITTATFDVVTGISDDDGVITTLATKLASVAGTYTETMYITLVTSY